MDETVRCLPVKSAQIAPKLLLSLTYMTFIIIFRSIGNDLNQTIYKWRLKSLPLTYGFDLNQSAEGDLWFWFKSILKRFWVLINFNNRKLFVTHFAVIYCHITYEPQFLLRDVTVALSRRLLLTCCLKQQEAQLMLTNPRDAFRGQSRSPNIVPFRMLSILSSCAIVTLTLRRAVFDIRRQKCRDLEIQVRSPKVIESGTIW